MEDYEIEVEDKKEKPGRIQYDDDHPNLVEVFAKSKTGKEALKRISNTVSESFKEARDGSEEYRKRYAKNLKLLSGNLPKKSGRLAKTANIHMPTSLENMSRLHFRMMGEVFLNNPREFIAFGAVGADPASQLLADMCGKHTNWQYRQMRDWGRERYRANFSYLFTGDLVSQSYYDAEIQQNRHTVRTPDETFFPYAHTSSMNDMSDMPFYGYIMYLYRNQLQARKGDWYDVKAVIDRGPPTWDDEPSDSVGEEAAKTQGIEVDAVKGWSPYKVVWWEGWLDLPGQERDRWCLCIFDPAHGAILKLAIHESEDPKDRVRFDEQSAEKASYMAQRASYEQMMSERSEMIAQQDAALEAIRPELGDVATAVGEQIVGEAQEMLVAPPEPMRPDWMDDDDAEPEPVKTIPIRMWCHAVCIEPLIGNVGWGYGQIQCDLNRAENTLMSQYIDSASFGNLKAFLCSDMVQLDPNAVLEPGVFLKVPNMGGAAIKEQVLPIEFGPGNHQLFESVGKLVEIGQSSMQSPAILSGEPGKSGETKGGTLARIEQASTQASVVSRKFCDEWVVPVVRNNCKLNAVNMPDRVDFFDNAPGQPVGQPMTVGRAMYENIGGIEVIGDLRFVSRGARIAEADEMIQSIKAMPYLGPGPWGPGNMAYAYSVLVDCLKARGKTGLIATLGPPPPNPQTPFGVPPPQHPAPPTPGVVPGKQGAPGVPTPKTGTAPESSGPPPGPPQGPGGPPMPGGVS